MTAAEADDDVRLAQAMGCEAPLRYTGARRPTTHGGTCRGIASGSELESASTRATRST
jgi:hypothetical protein